MAVLTRDSGPSGQARIEDQPVPIGGWELFEGDESNPNQCRGWFRADPEQIHLRKGDRLTLQLFGGDNGDRMVTAHIAHVSTTDTLWEFVADL